MKTLLYLENKSNATQLFTRILQNGFSKRTFQKGAKLVGRLLKINLKILWKHNFQLKDGEHDNIIFRDIFSLGGYK